MKIDIKKFDFESSKILSSLSRQERDLIESCSQILNFKKGKSIFYENGVPTGVYFIKKGKAKKFKTGLEGKEQIVYIYKAGDLLGYHALLCNENFEDSCEALENCELGFISKSKFEWLLDEIPKLKQRFILNMSHEFGVLLNMITVLAQKPLRERLALWLLILDAKYDNLAIYLPREDLANLIGTARESLGRLLKEFKEDSLIEINGRAIICVNREKLSFIALGKIK